MSKRRFKFSSPWGGRPAHVRAEFIKRADRGKRGGAG